MLEFGMYTESLANLILVHNDPTQHILYMKLKSNSVFLKTDSTINWYTQKIQITTSTKCLTKYKENNFCMVIYVVVSHATTDL